MGCAVTGSVTAGATVRGANLWRTLYAMPYSVRKGKGRKPYKIVNKTTGKQVGSSTSKTKAQKSASIRNRAH